MTGHLRVAPATEDSVPCINDSAMANYSIVNRHVQLALSQHAQFAAQKGIDGLLQLRDTWDAQGTPYIRSIDIQDEHLVLLHCQLREGSELLANTDSDESHLQCDVQFKPCSNYLLFEGAIHNQKIALTVVAFRFYIQNQTHETFLICMRHIVAVCEQDGFPINFRACNSIKSIAVDAHQGQLKGLYVFLGHEAFLELLAFCTTHFRRVAKESLDADHIDGQQYSQALAWLDTLLAEQNGVALASKSTVDEGLAWLAALGSNSHGTFTFYARKQNKSCIFPAYSTIPAQVRAAMPGYSRPNHAQ